MKKPIIFLAALLVFALLNPMSIKAQCSMIPINLSDKVTHSNQILDGKVISKRSFKNSENFIFTTHTIEVNNSYKGRNPSNIYIITEGGIVGNEMVRVDPNLELQIGQIGMFFLNKSRYQIPNQEKNALNYETYGLTQGFIQYNISEQSAADPFSVYPSISKDLIEKVMQYTNTTINYNIPQLITRGRRATPTISSISPTSLSSGTEQILTIKGTNFGNSKGNGLVGFKYGNDGGATWTEPLDSEYVSWSNTEIKVKVTAYAGTGKIQVKENGGQAATSGQTLTVRFAHSNATYTVGGITKRYQLQMIDLNGKGGIDWKVNKQFYDSTKALKSFVRSLETWRCGTYINWDTAGTTNSNSIVNNTENLVLWDVNNTMPAKVLGRCYSYYAGCSKGGVFDWYVKGLDIIFKFKYTKWNFGPAATKGGLTDFTSVATHELGHGTQLLHVINTNDVMHYSIGPNSDKRTLSANMIEGGKHVMNRSKTAVCSKKIIKPLDSLNCTYPPTVINFGVSNNKPCLEEEISFTDSSAGNITKYTWNFGTDASPLTAIGKGPHKVKYTSSGAKDVQLTLSTPYGDRIKKKVAYINPINAKSVEPSFTSVDLGAATIQFTNTSKNQTSVSWDFGDTKTSTIDDPKHTYDTKKSYTVKLTATNTCNSLTKTKTVIVTSDPVVTDFIVDNNAICLDENVNFTDLSTGTISAYAWSFGSNAVPLTALGKGPHKVKYTVGGKIEVRLITTSAAGLDTTSKSNYVDVAMDNHTKASFSYINNGTNTIDFTSTSTNATNYNWDFGDTKSSILKDPSHSYASVNTYSVKLTTSNTCNSDDTTVSVIVTSKPTVADFKVDTTKICKNESVTFTDISTGPVVSYAWNFGANATPASANTKGPHTIQYTAGGLKTVKLTVQTPTGEKIKTETDFINVNIDPIPVADAKWEHWGNNYYKFIDNSQFNSSLQWNFIGENDSSNAKSLMYKLTKAPYRVIHTISNKCRTIKTEFNLGNKVSLIEKESSDVKVFPNPAKDFITISPISKSIIDLEIINIQGQVVMAIHKKINSKFQIPLKLAEGIYFIKMEFEDKSTGIKKITIKY